MQHTKRTKAFITLFAVFLASCSNPKDTQVPSSVDSIESIKGSLEKLTPEDRELFAGYVMRHTIGSAFSQEKTAFGGISIGRAIEEQRTFIASERAKEAAEKALRDQVRKQRAQAIDAMRSIVTVALVSKKITSEKSYGGYEFDRKLDVVFAYKNNGKKAIAGVKGTINAIDLFGDKLSGFAISMDESIPPGESATWSGERSVTMSLGHNEDAKFASLPDEKFRLEWKPEQIVFADGSKLEAPDDPP